MSRAIKKSILVLFDSLSIILSSIVAYIFLNPYIELSLGNLLFKTSLTILIYLVLAVYFKLFSKINRYTSIKESFALTGSVTTAFILSSLIILFLNRPFSVRYALLGYIFSTSLIVGSRIIWRIYNEHHYKRMHLNTIERRIHTLVVGAGHGGSIFVRSLKRNDSDVKVMGLIDEFLTTDR